MNEETFGNKHAKFTLKSLCTFQEHMQVHIKTTIRHIHIHVQEKHHNKYIINIS